ncbi:hypothetical protein C0Z18_07760 [Trinickia dabaoshanensis]|uniref:GGDEF domain-containing protein n=1 Tax=Trinickia dabaoshanensis TaxID=564714 RepID=A0A2N7VX63_9BURK|nr:diguanylate cyclase [Trinickia dabaoshanensis]PMS21734.1 hypothetical protein C0Z18_07760 [Trinickia dabaoshanensis]
MPIGPVWPLGSTIIELVKSYVSLPGESLARAVVQVLAHRLIDQVGAVAQAEYTGRFQIGLSIGIATYPDRVAHIGDLIDVADAAMYAAKRNRSLFQFGPVTANEKSFDVRASK